MTSKRKLKGKFGGLHAIRRRRAAMGKGEYVEKAGGRSRRVRGELIKELLAKAPLTKTEVAKKAGISSRTIRTAEKGGRLDLTIIRRLACALKVAPEALIADVHTHPNTVAESPQIHEASGAIDEGTLREAISKAVQSAVGEGFAQRITVEVVIKITHHICIILGTISLLCAASGCVLINAVPLYITGGVLGTAGIILAIRRRSSYALPVFGVVASGIALLMWPNVIGVYQTPTGHRIGVYRRQIPEAWQAHVVLSFKITGASESDEILGISVKEFDNISIFINDVNINWKDTFLSKRLPTSMYVGGSSVFYEAAFRSLPKDTRIPLGEIDVSVTQSGPVTITVCYGTKVLGKTTIFVQPFDPSSGEFFHKPYYGAHATKEWNYRMHNISIDWPQHLTESQKSKTPVTTRWPGTDRPFAPEFRNTPK